MRIVIAGAGTAGCVLAARLSAAPGVEVVLLESGPHYRPGEWPPELRHAYRIIKETHDWGFTAQAGASPRGVHVPRGQVVGGSSVTNATIALRGLPEHYDDWAQFVPGLDWATMLPCVPVSTRSTVFPRMPIRRACSVGLSTLTAHQHKHSSCTASRRQVPRSPAKCARPTSSTTVFS